MRISGGQLKGRRVASRKVFFSRPEGEELRPTSSKVREALFDVLQDAIHDAVFVDLYAGTGAVGLEALSRGALQVFLIERNSNRVKAMQDFTKGIGVSERVIVRRETVDRFFKRSSASGAQFDIIFADPPYKSGEIMNVFRLFREYDVLKNSGCFVLEHASKFTLPDNTDPLKFTKRYTYGDTSLTLYRKSA